MARQKITPCLWFDSNAEEAVDFYTSVFKDSKILETVRYSEASSEAGGMPEGTVMTILFELNGQKFLALNGGPVFKFSEAVSFMVDCKDQKEIDYFWNKLSAVPESEQCGWLKDKFGLSWQIIPENLSDLLKNEKAVAALMQMKKINIKELEEAGE